MPIAIGCTLGGALRAYNIQMGYSPLKYLNFSGAYFREFGYRGKDSKGENSSYSLSLGSNYKIKWNGKVFLSKRTTGKIIRVEKGINFIFNVGYSVNRIKYNGTLRPGSGDLTFVNKMIRYNSVFTKLGFSYDYKWGKSGLSAILNINNYEELKFSGGWGETSNYLNKVSNYFETNRIMRVWSINFHNEIGRKLTKLVFGGNFVFTDQFGTFDEREEVYFGHFYIGVLIDLNKMSKGIKKRKGKNP